MIVDLLRLPEVLTVFSVITGVALGIRPRTGARSLRWTEALGVGMTTLIVAVTARDVPLAPSGIVIGFAVTAVLGDAWRRRKVRNESGAG